MDIVNGQNRIEWMLYDRLSQIFSEEEGEIIYTVTLVNKEILCPVHGLEVKPYFRITITFAKDGKVTLRADDICEILVSEEDINNWVDHTCDAFRRVELETDIGMMDE